MAIPEVNTPKRLAVKVSNPAQRMIRKEHPWVFNESIVKINHEDGNAGDLAIIFDKRNKFLALGLYDPHSTIRIKLLQFKKSANIDAAWFKDKVSEAYKKRKTLLKTKTNAYRLLHGENDSFPGLVVDVYDKVAVFKIYSLIWLPYLQYVMDAIVEIAKIECIVLRTSRNVADHEVAGFENGKVIYGTLKKEEITFKEHGLLFTANVVKGHKTGYFLDHRHNRRKVGKLAKDKTVLDVFSYAGGFSVHALAGGASEVTSLDISGQALQMATKNAILNSVQANHKTMVADAFKGMQKLLGQNKRFDIVIVDPPSFAKQKSEIEKALASYTRLFKLALALVDTNGVLVLASCSSRVSRDAFFELIENLLREKHVSFELMNQTFHDDDHPIAFPEAAYLKCGFL